MSEISFKFDKADRTLLQRLFEPPAVGQMAPVAKIVAYLLLAFWSIFVLFPIYWVVITSFKDAAAVNQGPYYIPFVDHALDVIARTRMHFDADTKDYVLKRTAEGSGYREIKRILKRYIARSVFRQLEALMG